MGNLVATSLDDVEDTLYAPAGFAVPGRCRPCGQSTLIWGLDLEGPWSAGDGVDGMVTRIIARVPTRVVWGRGDPYIPERYASAFPGAPPKLLDRAGHWVPISSPDEVAAAIRAVAT